MSMLSLATRFMNRLVRPRPSSRGRPRPVSTGAMLSGASMLVMGGLRLLGSWRFGSWLLGHPGDGGRDALLHHRDRLADVDGEAAFGVGQVAGQYGFDDAEVLGDRLVDAPGGQEVLHPH